MRGSLLLARKDDDGAANDLSEAMRRGRQDAVVYMLRGTSLRDSNPATAESNLTTALKKDQNYSMAYLVRGRVRAASGNEAGAEEDFTAAIAAGLTDENVFLARGIVRFGLGRLAQAEEDFNYVLPSRRGADQLICCEPPQE